MCLLEVFRRARINEGNEIETEAVAGILNCHGCQCEWSGLYCVRVSRKLQHNIIYICVPERDVAALFKFLATLAIEVLHWQEHHPQSLARGKTSTAFFMGHKYLGHDCGKYASYYDNLVHVLCFVLSFLACATLCLTDDHFSWGYWQWFSMFSSPSCPFAIWAIRALLNTSNNILQAEAEKLSGFTPSIIQPEAAGRGLYARCKTR